MSVRVGIIANPASGKDIRRLIAHATTVDNQGKISIIRRVLLGLGAMGVQYALVMPDIYRLAEQAARGLVHSGDPFPAIEPLAMEVNHSAEDSQRAAALLAEAQVGCIIVLGGDGTLRVVSKGAGEVPLLPISTGTNNVLPTFVEGTIAGLAAGALAGGEVPLQAVALRHKWLDITVDGAARERALVDVAVLRGQFIGARAVWEPEDLRQIIVTRADPTSIGISAIAALVSPITPDDPHGLAVGIDPAAPRQVLAALAPGLLRPIGIGGVRVLDIGDRITVGGDEPLILALDGEREIALRPGQRCDITLRSDGPWIVDPDRVMRAIVSQGLLDRR